MNLIIATPGLPTGGTYAQLYVVEQAGALARAGHQVVLLCIRPRGEAGTSGRRGASVEDVHGLRAVIAEYPVVRGLSFLPQILAFERALKAARRLFRPDLIHAQITLPVGLAGVVCGLRAGIPVVITEHTGPVRANCERRSSRAAMRFALSRARGVVAVSEALEGELRDVLDFHKPIQVIPNLYNPRVFYPAKGGADDPTTQVLFVGRGGDTRKGNDLALSALATARGATSRPIRMVFAGPGLEEELAAKARELGVGDLCEFVGLIPSERLGELMRRSAFLVAPSRYETFCIAVIEAMACGKPVIAARCGGPDRIVTPEVGVLVPVGDVGSLAAAMVAMADDPARYDAGRIADHADRLYSDRAVGGRLARYYESILDPEAPRSPS